MFGLSIAKLWPWLLICNCFGSLIKYIEEYDPIRVVRCDAKCDGYSPIEECIDLCISTNYTKPGNCPERNSMSPFEAACLIACSNDSECPDLAKCCSNDCGVTCMHPTGLGKREDLPSIPDTIEIRREKSNKITLNWTTKKKDSLENDLFNTPVRYLIEERHVLGPRYLDSRLTPWSVLNVSSKSHLSTYTELKKGHWYQFRVAAVNENGSRGYSNPSIPFKTSEPKNPREPRNLSLSGARVQPADGKLRILLRWKQPSSDIPIMFYKLFWSQLIRGPTNESILIYHRSISKDKSCFEIKNLEIGVQYFLQVQAVSVYGGRHLASRKASKVFNSTDYPKYADVEGRFSRCERHHVGLRVRRLICQCGEDIEARLVWPGDPEATSYNISWKKESCGITKNSKIIHNLISAVSSSQIIQKTRFDIKGLDKNCTYTVNVRSINGINKKENENDLERSENWETEERNLAVEFVTNGCQRRQNRGSDRLGDYKTAKCKKRKARIKKIYNNKFL
ncbi:anosmin-1 [Chelonus insularis]|uniref:anosmin-1 n=1 Tax=Chelonus insularis TaxID=460826 RepID=UPI00158EDAE1|nr:anosmin-1 [Chelonus insularis]